MLGRRPLILALAGIAAGAPALSPALAQERVRLRVRELWGAGAVFSAQAEALAGETVEMTGFMAPPIKVDADFFVLTKMPMAVCPFCDSAMDWPRDIVLVKLAERQDWIHFNEPILVTGRLELGTDIDPETGFVSRVRLVDARYERG